MREISIYILTFFICSFCGWVNEVIISIFKRKKLVNRGFCVGPICPVYGFGYLLIILVLGKYQNDYFVLFLGSMVLCGTLEYITSYLLEKTFNLRWWDYSDKPFNLNGRIALDTTIAFGIAGLLSFKYILPILDKFFNLFDDKLLIIVSICLTIMLLIDFIFSFSIVSKIKSEFEAKKDITDKISIRIKEKLSNLSFGYKRIFVAYPKLKESREYLYYLQKSFNKKIIDKLKRK